MPDARSARVGRSSEVPIPTGVVSPRPLARFTRCQLSSCGGSTSQHPTPRPKSSNSAISSAHDAEVVSAASRKKLTQAVFG